MDHKLLDYPLKSDSHYIQILCPAVLEFYQLQETPRGPPSFFLISVTFLLLITPIKSMNLKPMIFFNTHTSSFEA